MNLVAGVDAQLMRNEVAAGIGIEEGHLDAIISAVLNVPQANEGHPATRAVVGTDAHVQIGLELVGGRNELELTGVHGVVQAFAGVVGR